MNWMMDLGNFFGSLLGYLLWPLYIFFRNYGVAIILFTIIVKFLMFPFSIKQQKSMAASSKLQAKQKELQEKYGNDKMKMNEEMQKLYEKEGVNPMGGCLPMLIPFPIMIGIYYTVINPLSNVLHLSGEAVSSAVSMLQKIPGISSAFSNSFYAEMQIIQHYDALKPHLTMFTESDLAKIDELSQGFQFLGLDLLGTPADTSLGIFGQILSVFNTNLWVIPVFCLLFSLMTQFITMKLQPGMQQQQGCMKVMLYGMAFFSAWLAMTLPGAVGFYWIISTLTSFGQTVLMHTLYSPAKLIAKAEAQRIALREIEEKKVEPLSAAEQKQMAEKLNSQQSQQSKKNSEPVKKAAQNSASQKQKGNKSKSTDSYLGSKK